MLWWFLIWQLLCEWYVTIKDHSLLSVLYMYDSFFNRYVTPWMKNSSVMLLPGWLPQFFKTFCHRNSKCCLLDLSASEHWSPVSICGCYSSFAELLSYEKPSRHDFVTIRTYKDFENSLKCAPATPDSSVLSFGTNYSHSQSHDTIPLKSNGLDCLYFYWRL